MQKLTNLFPAELIPTVMLLVVLLSQLTFARHHSYSRSSSSGDTDTNVNDHGPPCTRADCENRGECIGTTNSLKCYCDLPYSGRRCQKRARNLNNNDDGRSSFNGWNGGGSADCSPAYCNNHGLCAVGNSVYVCQCAKGYFGSRCENVGTASTNSQQSVPQTQQIYPQAQNGSPTQQWSQTQEGNQWQGVAQNVNQGQIVPRNGAQGQQLSQNYAQGLNKLQNMPQSQVFNQGQTILQNPYQISPNLQTSQTPQGIPTNQQNGQINLAALVEASLAGRTQNVARPPIYSTQPLAGYPAYNNGLNNGGLTNAVPLVYAGG